MLSARTFRGIGARAQSHPPQIAIQLQRNSERTIPGGAGEFTQLRTPQAFARREKRQSFENIRLARAVLAAKSEKHGAAEIE